LHHDRHFSDASSFQIGVSRGRRTQIERNAGLGLAVVAFDLQPAVAAVEALRGRRRRVRRSAIALHSDRPGFGLGAIGLSDRLPGALARALGANPGARYHPKGPRGPTGSVNMQSLPSQAVGVPELSSCEMAVTSWAGANGLVIRMLLGTPLEAHSSALSPVM